MKTTFLFVVAFFISNSILGQTMSYYSFRISIMYLPTCGRADEWYIKKNDKLQHGLLATNYRCKESKKKLSNDKEIEAQINQLDSLFRLKEFKFFVKRNIINSLKDDKFANTKYNINNSDIIHLFPHGDTAIINLNDIEKNNTGYIDIMVMDGAPYRVQLVIKRNGQDTIKYEFKGNTYMIM